MYFGMFGSIFFLSQFLQNVLGNTPLQAGVKLLVWTGATMVVSPLAGFFSERFGSRLFMVAGLALQAIALGWLATDGQRRPSRYASMIGPFILARRRHGAGVRAVGQRGAGLGPHRPGRARPRAPPTRSASSAACSGSRCSSTVFTSHGGYGSPQAFVDGLTPAMWVGAGGARRRRADRAGVPVQHRAALAQAEVERRAADRVRPASSPGCRPDRRPRSLTRIDDGDDHRHHRSSRVSASRRPSAGTR